MTNINMRELENITEQLVEYLKGLNLDEIELSTNKYWALSADQKYSLYETPTSPAIRQLTADWREVQNSINNESADMKSGLICLGEVLKAIGREVL